MKKIGILFGKERSFPMAFIERVNSKQVEGVVAEPVHINKVIQGAAGAYAVIIDRISHEVPFYRAFLKDAAICGTAIINNPFWSSADEKFFNNSLAVKTGIPVPRTVILPSYEIPPHTSNDSFPNLAWPLDWQGIFEYVGFPAYMKPLAGGGWKSVYKLHNPEEFFRSHRETGQLVMLLQEAIVYEEYYRCYCIGGKYVHIMPYDPRNPHHLRYHADFVPPPNRVHQMEEIVRQLNHFLGYDFNSVELAIRDGVPYAIDFCNPVPDADLQSVGTANFEWVVETAATYAIERALLHEPDKDNLTWGKYIVNSINRTPLIL
jgi:Glutathione synthase/Ribosomal protein S6 modification enzyme (glutaminyl transferase)